MEATTNTRRFVSPDIVSTHFHIKPGDVVADFGAGSGYFVPALARATGGSGKVYACEIQKNLVETIGNVVRQQGLSNVDPLWCDLEEPQGIKIADAAVDVGVMVNTLFQVEDAKTAVSEIARTLRSGGNLFIIDWTESFAGLGPQPDDIVPETAARSVAEAAGFQFVRSFDAGDHHYGVALQKV